MLSPKQCCTSRYEKCNSLLELAVVLRLQINSVRQLYTFFILFFCYYCIFLLFVHG